MDFTQQLKLPRSQQSNPRQALLIKIAVIGAILAVLLMVISMFSGGKSSQPQMISVLESQYQLMTAAELVQDYETSTDLKNTAASIQSVTGSTYRDLESAASSVYTEFEFKPTFDPTEVEEALQAAQQQNNTDERATVILNNALSVSLNDLEALAAATSNQDILAATDTARTNLKTLQAQLSGN